MPLRQNLQESDLKKYFYWWTLPGKFMINQNQLKFLRYKKYTAEDVQLAAHAMSESRLCSLIRINPDKSLVVTLSKSLYETGQGHMPTCNNFITAALQSWQGEAFQGSFILWNEDVLWDTWIPKAMQAPVLAFGRRIYDHHTFLIPDPAFVNSKGYEQERRDLEKNNQEIPWEDRKPVLFWRGSASGMYMETDSWNQEPRIRLAVAAKELGDDSRLDVKISNIPEFRPYARERVEALKVGAPYLPFNEFFKYRHLIDADGVGSAWVSCFLKLASGSTLVKLESTYEQWYYREMLPWKHYVPILQDLRNLEAITDWVLANDVACHEIAKAGAALAASITYEKAVIELGQLLHDICVCQTN